MGDLSYIQPMKIFYFIPVLLCGFAYQGFSKEVTGTVVSLSAVATTEVANDEVVVRFRVEDRGKDLDALRQRVNQMSNAIQQSLAKEKGVKLETSSRSVNPVWKPNQYNRVQDGWVVVQTGVITSKNLEGVPHWLHTIEKAGANLQSLSFRVSDALRRSTQEALHLQAIKQFRLKAETVSKALDAKSFYIRHLNTGNSYSPQPMYRGEVPMMSKSMDTTPALSSGDSRMTVSVHGDIEVEKQQFKVNSFGY